MSFIGNIQSARAISKYNASVSTQEAKFLRAKAEVNERFYENVTLP